MKKATTFLLVFALLSIYSAKRIPIFAEKEEEEEYICKTSFEDGDFSMFTPRGSDEVLTIIQMEVKPEANISQ